MATKEEKESKRLELDAATTEREQAFATLDATRTPYREALVVAQEKSDREHALEDEYEAMIVEDEPPARPTE